jgi:hypothetical protein
MKVVFPQQRARTLVIFQRRLGKAVRVDITRVAAHRRARQVFAVLDTLRRDDAEPIQRPRVELNRIRRMKA